MEATNVGAATSTPGLSLRRLSTAELTAADIDALRALLARAFSEDEDGPLTEEDWQHALGGVHVIADVEDAVVAHAAVVERALHVGGRPVRTGYVEAVAVDPDWQGRGIGTTVMAAVGGYVRATFEIGALATGKHHFYEREGWTTWQGPAAVRTATGEEPTPDEDGYILVLATPTTPWDPLPLDAPISCDWRPGDVW